MQIDEIKFNELYTRVKNKNNQLLDSINKAIMDEQDNDTIDYLKFLQSQCAAELRVLNYIKDGMTGDFLVC